MEKVWYNEKANVLKVCKFPFALHFISRVINSSIIMEELFIMSNKTVTPADFFNPETQVAHLALIACPGAEALAEKIDKHLVKWAQEVGIDKNTFLYYNKENKTFT